MACGPRMVGRVPPAAGGDAPAAPGIAHRRACLGPGRVEPSGDDRRRVRSIAGWLGWAAVAVGVAATVVSLL